MYLEFVKECTKIKNSNNSLIFTYNKLSDDSVLVGIGNNHLKQIFFVKFVFTSEGVNLFLLNNYNNDNELIVLSTDSKIIRRKIIELLKEIYPLNKSDMSKKYCYPRSNIKC